MRWKVKQLDGSSPLHPLGLTHVVVSADTEELRAAFTSIEDANFFHDWLASKPAPAPAPAPAPGLTERELELIVMLVKAYAKLEQSSGVRAFPEQILDEVNMGMLNKFTQPELEAIKRRLRS